ncbi:MAG: T9SS type A sorting domain-containing protein [Candidatus Symbiothrix sp.]|jgi:hypothetical protein|nr:T9SS type A sorting domain-containing protein [Candidatus Symbiothrix sp.]
MKKTLLFLAICLTSVNTTLFSKTSDGAWPPASDYTIQEWHTGMGHIDFNQIVYYAGGFYQCTAEDGTESWSDPWNPTEWEAPHYAKVAEGQLWEVNLGTITAGTNYIWESAVYECILSGDSWGDGFSPTGWNSTSYTKICNIEMVPLAENPLPANYVGYWYDNDLSWLPGWIAIDAVDIVDPETGEVVHTASHLVYKCVAKTNPNGGEYPGSAFGHWQHEEPWNTPPTPMGEEKDLLTLEGVSIPEWTDEPSWPVGAIVSYNSNYYTCLVQTHKGGGETPETTWGYWEPLNLYSSIQNIGIESLKYSVKDGILSILNASNANIELYNVAGQLVAKTSGAFVELPQKGVYVAKMVVDGKTATLKVVR